MEIPLLDLQQKVTLEALLCQHDMSHKQAEIVRILGGINVILNHYITSGDLGEDQIERIIALIRIESEFNDIDQSMTTLQAINDFSKISLNRNDTILHKLFPGPNSEKLVTLLRHKALLALSIFTGFVITVINVVAFFGYQIFSYSGVIATASVTIQIIAILFLGFPVCLYSMGLVLLINVKALKLLSKTFLFWFKLVYFCQWLVCLKALDFINDSAANRLYYTSKTATYIISEMMTISSVVMIVIVVSSMDGLYLNMWSKRVFLVFISFSFLVGFVNYWIFGESYYPITSITVLGYELHLLQWMRSAVQTLLIFFVNQTISFWRNPTKSTVIGKPTYILWTE